VSVWNGMFFCLREHIDRFKRSCDALRLVCPYDESALGDLLGDLVRRAGLQSAYVQMIVTRGTPAPGSRDPRTCKNRFLAFCVPYIHIAPDQGRGALHLIVSRRPRIAAASVPSQIKNYHWIDFELALFEAYERGGNAVVLTDGRGAISEGPGFNVFAVRNGALTTPSRNVLAGVTRAITIELARELGFKTRVRRLPVGEFLESDEVFVSSTAGGIMPVATVDGTTLPAGAPGPVSAAIRQLYWKKREAGWRGTPIEYGDAKDTGRQP
jgi:branched-chain amino acid aminotransferase